MIIISSDEAPPGRTVQLDTLIETMNRAAEEERRSLSSTRRVVTRLSIARLMIAARRARTPFIDADLLGEPAWDIMLCLYVAYREGRAIEMTAVLAASQLRATVARRWVDILSHKQLIAPIVAIAEDGKQFVYLTDKAVAAMEGAIDHYLATGAENL